MTTVQPLSDLDQTIIAHVTEIIARLARDQPYLAKQMFAEEVWDSAPTLYGQRIAFLAETHRLPLSYHDTTSSNSHLYLITSE